MNTNFFPWKLVSFSSSSYTQGMFKAIARPRRGRWSQPTYNQKAHFISIGAGRSDLSPPLPLRFGSLKLPHFGFFFVLSLSHSTLLWLITFNGGHGHVGGFNFRLPSAACPMLVASTAIFLFSYKLSHMALIGCDPKDSASLPLHPTLSGWTSNRCQFEWHKIIQAFLRSGRARSSERQNTFANFLVKFTILISIP